MNLRTDDIDVPALRAALRDTALAIIAVKRRLRSPWTEPMAHQQRQLLALKDKATQLCILRAYLRGRYHLQRPPRRIAATAPWDRQAFHRTAAAHAADRYQLFVAEVPPTGGRDSLVRAIR